LEAKVHLVSHHRANLHPSSTSHYLHLQLLMSLHLVGLSPTLAITNSITNHNLVHNATIVSKSFQLRWPTWHHFKVETWCCRTDW